MLELILLIIGIVYAVRRPKLKRLASADYPDVEKSQFLEWKAAELKGITIYRDGSRGQSPLVPLPLSEAKKHLEQMEEEASVNDCPSGSCDAIPREKGTDVNE